MTEPRPTLCQYCGIVRRSDCDGHGWVTPLMPLTSHKTYKSPISCANLGQKLRQKYFHKIWPVPALLAKANFTKENPDATAKVRAWADSYLAHPNGHAVPLTFDGPSGPGKSWLAVAAARYLYAKAGKIHCFVAEYDLINSIKRTFNEKRGGEESEESILDEINGDASPDVLILDDICKNVMTEWHAETLFMVIDQRIRDARPIIITTNKPLTVLEANEHHQWDAIVDRLRGGVVIPMLGKSLRHDHK